MEEAIAKHVIGNVFIKDIKSITHTDETIKIKTESLFIDTNRCVVVKNVEKKDIGF